LLFLQAPAFYLFCSARGRSSSSLACEKAKHHFSLSFLREKLQKVQNNAKEQVNTQLGQSKQPKKL